MGYKISYTTSSQYEITEITDRTAPLLVSAVIPADGLTIALTYDESLDSGSIPSTSDFSVSGTSSVINSVGISGTVLTLTMDTAIFLGEVVLLDYTSGTNPIQDDYDNESANLSSQSVTNNSISASYPLTGLLASYDVTEKEPNGDLTNLYGSANAVYISGSGLDEIYDFSGLGESKLNKSNATYWGATPNSYFYYDPANPYHYKLEDFHFRNIRDFTTIDDELFLKAQNTTDVSDEIANVDALLIYDSALTGADLTEAKTFAEIFTFWSDNLLTNCGATGKTDWVDSNSDGLADDWWTLQTPTNQTFSIVTGNGFSGNAQKLEVAILDAACSLSYNDGTVFRDGRTHKLSCMYRTDGAFAIYRSGVQNFATIPTNTGDAILYENDNLVASGSGYLNLVTNKYILTVGEYFEIDEVEFNLYCDDSYKKYAEVYYFGDSWVEGIHVNTSSRWTYYLSEAMGWIQNNLGVGGEHITDYSPNPSTTMLDRLDEIPTKDTKDRYLFFAYGINDVGMNFDGWTTELFLSQYTTIINAAKAKGWSKENIMLVNIGYVDQTKCWDVYTDAYGVTGNDTRLQAYIAAVNTLSTEATILEIYDDMVSGGGDSLMVFDGLHPSASGHQVISDSLQTQIEIIEA